MKRISKDHPPSRIRRNLPITTALACCMVITGCGHLHQGPANDHFDGSRFYNREADNGFVEHIRWIWEMQQVPWPEWIDDPAQPSPPATVESPAALRVTYVNQATVLIQSSGVNILTDPIWSNRAGPLPWLGSKRIRTPGIAFDKLPHIDVVLLSHDHFDHLDLPTLTRLISRDHPIVLAGLGVGKRLTGVDANLRELDWWESASLEQGGTITFVPARHNSGRGLFDGNATLWGGFALELPAGRVLFMGDTAYGEHIEAIHQRFGNFRLAILPIGNYEARWFMQTQHMNPDDAVRAHKTLNARHSMGVHFATFDEHPEQSISAHETDLATARREQHVPAEAFWLPAFGEGKDF